MDEHIQTLLRSSHDIPLWKNADYTEPEMAIVSNCNTRFELSRDAESKETGVASTGY